MTSYTPTEADKLTGARLRQLRKRRGETMQEMIDRSGVPLKQSSISRVELGDRRLTEIEAAKLAAHFNVAVSQILRIDRPFEFGDPTVETEQQFLGNDKPALFAVPDRRPADELTVPDVQAELERRAAAPAQHLLIDLDNPMPAEQYRQTVWLPYLEARYNAEQKAS